MMTTNPSSTLDAAGQILDEALTRYYPTFARGARLVPATPENQVAVECLMEACPPIMVAATHPGGEMDSEELLGNMMKAILAAQGIGDAINAGAQILEPETKTPGANPRG